MNEDGFSKLLEKQHYSLIGAHSAVKPCLWLKKALRGEGFCYKQKFYGIKSHRCMQMTPAVKWCTHACLFCWRNTDHTSKGMVEEPDEPGTLIEGAIAAHRQAISGFKGSQRVDPKMFEEALNPNQVAISLAGEPMAYPYMGELIREFKKKDMTTYLVTNGTYPHQIENLSTLPTNMYVSLVAPDEATHKKVNVPLIPDAWEKIQASLKILSTLSTTTVIRVTAVKGLNMCDPKGYARLIETADPDYVEVKAFMFVGGARERLSLENMPGHDEVKAFAKEVAAHLGYELADEKKESRVTLLKRR